MQFQRSLEVVDEPDVLVVGAGSAGIAAAVAAARHGARTLIVERCGFAGGYISAITGISFDGMVDLRSGLPVVGGVAFEFVKHAGVFEQRIGSASLNDIASVPLAPNSEIGQTTSTPERSVIKIDVERFKRMADQMFRDAGIRVLYHTQVVDVSRRDDRIEGVVLANKAGLTVVKPQAIVDASGDADVAAFGGAPFELDLEALQPMSLHFRVGDVRSDPDLKADCAKAAALAYERGDLPLYGGPWMNRWPGSDGEYLFNATRVTGNPVDPDDLTNAEIQGRQDAHVMFEAFRESIPAFKDAYFVTSGPVVGARESRRIRGERTLTLQDITEHREYDDVICLGNWWLDRHPKTAGLHRLRIVRPYDISYGTLVPQGLSNVWVAGRCHSAEPDALASSRVNITCTGMGQAAGTAAALAAQGGYASRDLPTSQLQSTLLADGAIILERARDVLSVGDALDSDAPANIEDVLNLADAARRRGPLE